MNKIKIYLAGAMMHCKTFDEMNAWRVEVSNGLLYEYTHHGLYQIGINDLTITNPCSFYNFQNPRHQNEREVMQYDLAKVRNSDVVIVNLKGLNTSIGTAIELYEAYSRDIPVIAYDIEGDYPDIHSWLKCCITRVETSLEDLTEYMNDFYF